MYYILISFKSLPKIGFAHHFHAKNYRCVRKGFENSLEIVYIDKGNLNITLDGKTFTARPGSIFFNARTLPFTFETDKDAHHSHSTIQLISDFNFEIIKDKNLLPKEFDGIILPFITEPCNENEQARKIINSIISDISASRELNGFESALKSICILETQNKLHNSDLLKHSSDSSIICYKIKRYISEHINEKITLTDIENHIGKTSIYLNSIFKKNTGTTITKYINAEKVRLITELMENKSLSFKSACYNAGISDISYGYRLFKKFLGVTPSEFNKSNHFYEARAKS